VLRAPTLGAALETFCTMAEWELAPVRYRLVRTGDAVRIASALGKLSLCEADNCGEWLRIMPLLAIVRHFADSGGMPTAIAFRSRSAPGQSARLAFPGTRLLTGQAETAIVFPASLLHLTAIGDPSREEAFSMRRRLSAAPGEANWDFPTSLREVLRAYLDDGHPSVELAAEIVCTTVRTLQRRLRQYDLSYSDILEQLRFEEAKHLLRDRDVKMIDAAYALGYSDPSNFTRAFRRMAGVSPRQFRAESVALSAL